MTQGNGLSDAYTETLTRLKAQRGNKSILGMKVLMWVLYSEQPLKVEELCHALGVELGSTDLDHENVPALRTLLASSLGLVTVEVSSSTLRLVHFTLQEHFLSDSTLFHSSHSTIAEACLTYLNFQSVRDLSPTLQSAPATMPLLQYASYYWGEHTRKGMTENVKILALRLLVKFEGHISAQLVLLRYNQQNIFSPNHDSEKGPIGFTGLHGTAFLGIVEIFAAVLEMKKWDVKARDNASCTPLMWAAVRGHEGVVKMLLERGDVNPDLADRRCNLRPLERAAVGGHMGVIKVFLERGGVDPDHSSPVYAAEALWYAAKYGREAIVKIILEREDLNPNQIPAGYHFTPLSTAAVLGREGVVKILLGREDVDPNIVNTSDGRTPLSHAAMYGYEGIVKMLLDRNDIHIIPDHENKTALSWALDYRQDKIARMISERTASMSETADPGSQESLPPSAGDEDEFMAETEPSDDYSNTNTADPGVEPTSPPADSHVLEVVPDCECSFPDSTDSIIPSATELSCSPQPPSPKPLKFQYSRSQTATHPNNPPSTVSIMANQHFIIATFICILAILLYVLPFSLPNIFSLP